MEYPKTTPVCIFEDALYSRLHPLSLTRPVFALRCGILTLREKIERLFPGHRLILFCRGYLRDLVQKQNPDTPINGVDSDDCLFINGRLVADERFREMIQTTGEVLFLHDGDLVAAYLRDAHLAEFVSSLDQNATTALPEGVKRIDLDDLRVINYPWDLVHYNASELTRDFEALGNAGRIEGEVSEHAILLNDSGIHVGKDSVIKPGAVLDAEEGPIFVGEDVTVMHNAVIEGPAFIGDRSSIRISAKIYAGTSIGEVCKVGGEVEESIIHSYSNKQHDGFLGHAYLGQWVNLGADTNNSDLKNNYTSVKVPVNGVLVDSGSMFVGVTIGDHSKSGINTMFNTGTVVGTMCNVYGGGFPPKNVPSFSWGGADGFIEHHLEKAIETARRVMARRKQELGPEYEAMMRHVFELTGSERS